MSLASALVCALVVAYGAALPPYAVAAGAELERWTQGPQPPFTLPSANGADVALDSVRGQSVRGQFVRGQVVLVHFFATWCEPCREELPALNRLTARANGTVKVLAISVGEVDLRVRRFIETMPVNYPVLLDRAGAVARAWRVATLPTTFVLDADLQPRLVVETGFAWDKIDPGKFPEMLTLAPSWAPTWSPAGREIAQSPNNRLHRGG